ncbi:hypothetical protein F5887DRAFT_1084852 [Amanita rubescens]|nr:hypothetical protein F5887DRAFT_1084852 [Amanita rubescens]
MDNQQQALVNAYLSVGRRVNETLRIQNGSVVRLHTQQDEVRAFAANANRAQNLLSEENYSILQDSILSMQKALEDAVTIANDDLTRDLIPLIQRTPQDHGL